MNKTFFQKSVLFALIILTENACFSSDEGYWSSVHRNHNLLRKRKIDSLEKSGEEEQKNKKSKISNENKFSWEQTGETELGQNNPESNDMEFEDKSDSQ